jgi:tetratricopeptide (TPR) repeat protein
MGSMKYRVVLLAVALLVFLPIANPSQTSATYKPTVLTPQELFKKLAPSVFVVEALDSNGDVEAFGSGVSIAPGQIVTNTHVVEEGTLLRVSQGDLQWVARVTHLSPSHDLCLLTVEELKAPPVPVRKSSTLEVGERVYAIGAPLGLELTLSEGIISGLRKFRGVRFLQTTAAVSPGSSGGGLFDAKARLVGITTVELEGGQNLNLALPGEAVLALARHPAPPGASVSSSAGERDYRRVEDTQQRIPFGDEAHAWLERGLNHVENGRYNDAIKAYREAISRRKNYGEAWLQLGLAYMMSGRYAQAMNALHRAADLLPNEAEPLKILSLVYVLAGDYSQASHALQRAILAKPDDADTWLELGDLYLEWESYHKAIESYKQVLDLDTENAQARVGLGDAFKALGKFEDTVAWYRSVTRAKPQNSDDWVVVGNAYSALYEHESAERAYEEAVRLKPDNAEAWYRLGLAYAKQDRKASVIEVYRELEKLDPYLAKTLAEEAMFP